MEWIPPVLVGLLVAIISLILHASQPPAIPPGYERIVSNGRFVTRRKQTYSDDIQAVVAPEQSRKVKSLPARGNTAFEPDVELPAPYLETSPLEMAARGIRLEAGDWYGVYRDQGLSHEEIKEEFPHASNLELYKEHYES